MLVKKLIVLILLLTACVSADTLPSISVKSTLKTATGSSLGYGYPVVGNNLNFKVSSLPRWKDIKFTKTGKYIPLPGPLKVTGVESYGNGDWKSFRMTSKSRSSKVTFDVIRSRGNLLDAWILVERKDRIQGAFYLRGTFE